MMNFFFSLLAIYVATGADDEDTHFSSYAITLADRSTDGICGSRGILEKKKKMKKNGRKKEITKEKRNAPAVNEE